MNTTRTAVRLAATTAVLAGAAVFTAAPSFAGPPPEDPAADSSTSRGAGQSSQTQIEHDKAIAGSRGMTAQIKAKIEAMERAQQDPQPAAESGTGSSGSSDPSSVPVTVLVLLGGGLVAGAAGYTVYRFRHHGPVGAATA